jgi:hypothetical protein
MAAASERVLWGRHRPACITTRDVIGGLQENLTDIQALSAVTAGVSRAGPHWARRRERGHVGAVRADEPRSMRRSDPNVAHVVRVRTAIELLRRYPRTND